MTYQILHGNNLDILPTLEDNSIDSIVTDPPYELGFMGKKWDSSGIAYSVELWQQCLRVLKPGGHLLAFGGSRTYHRMVVAIEDAGFEIRDMISWISNKTFPKSLNIGKAIDKLAGAEREVIGTYKLGGNAAQTTKEKGGTFASNTNSVGVKPIDVDITRPATDEAKQWDGWGTGLKPTVEPIVMARKPVEGTIANNVLKYGTGGLNIDGSRIGFRTEADKNNVQNATWYASENTRLGKLHEAGEVLSGADSTPDLGRWPANIILDPYTAELLDEQSGQVRSNHNKTNDNSGFGDTYVGGSLTRPVSGPMYSDSGGASRFFYVAKASKRDRNEGLDELPLGESKFGNQKDTIEGSLNSKHRGAPRQNFHPTVKPTTLMEYLIKLVTPPGGVVLDPFTGSGSTGKAAILQGFDFIGIEMTEEYLPIIEGRLKHAEQLVAEAKEQDKAKENEVLF